MELLGSFLGGRAAGYSSRMSSPVTAWDGCSRLSPYLAWGCISLRTVYQRTKAAADALRAARTGSKRGSAGGKAAAKKRQRRGKQQQEEEEEPEDEQVDEEGEAASEDTAVEGTAAAAGAPGGSGAGAGAVGLKDLAAFTARLRWRSHFMQVCGQRLLFS